MDALKLMQEKAVDKITGIRKGEERPCTPEEISEMWEHFYSKTPEERRAGIMLLKTFFPDVVPAEIIAEMEKRVDEKGFI